MERVIRKKRKKTRVDDEGRGLEEARVRHVERIALKVRLRSRSKLMEDRWARGARSVSGYNLYSLSER
jgi:hypothetical protein